MAGAYRKLSRAARGLVDTHAGHLSDSGSLSESESDDSDDSPVTWRAHTGTKTMGLTTSEDGSSADEVPPAPPAASPAAGDLGGESSHSRGCKSRAGEISVGSKNKLHSPGLPRADVALSPMADSGLGARRWLVAVHAALVATFNKKNTDVCLGLPFRLDRGSTSPPSLLGLRPQRPPALPLG